MTRDSQIQIGIITVTLSAAAHLDISEKTPIDVLVSQIKRILPVDPALGIGRSIIFLSDGTSLNIEESLQQLPACLRGELNPH